MIRKILKSLFQHLILRFKASIICRVIAKSDIFNFVFLMKTKDTGSHKSTILGMADKKIKG